MKNINTPAHIFINAQIILLIVKSREISPRGMKIVPSRRRVRSPRSKISGIQGNYLNCRYVSYCSMYNVFTTCMWRGRGGGESIHRKRSSHTRQSIPYHFAPHLTGNKGIYPLGCSPHVNDIITINMLDLFLLFG